MWLPYLQYTFNAINQPSPTLLRLLFANISLLPVGFHFSIKLLVGSRVAPPDRCQGAQSRKGFSYFYSGTPIARLQITLENRAYLINKRLAWNWQRHAKMWILQWHESKYALDHKWSVLIKWPGMHGLGFQIVHCLWHLLNLYKRYVQQKRCVLKTLILSDGQIVTEVPPAGLIWESSPMCRKESGEPEP